MFTKPGRLIDRVFVHCSASDRAAHDNIRTMRKWHTDPKPRGREWSDVGYHYFIRKDGKLETGRPISKTPAAQRSHNSGTIAICLHGLDEPNFSEAQFDTLRSLCLEINNAHNGQLTFHGHREVAAKACPVFDYKTVLKLDKFGRLGLTGARKLKLASDTERNPTTLPVLKRGDRGNAVALLQRLLLLKDDGIFGPRTDSHVRDFQTEKRLKRDGVVGEKTWTKLFANDRVEHFGGS